MNEIKKCGNGIWGCNKEGKYRIYEDEPPTKGELMFCGRHIRKQRRICEEMSGMLNRIPRTDKK